MTNETDEKIKGIVKFLEQSIETQEETVKIIEKKAVLLITFCTTVMGYILPYDAGLQNAYTILTQHSLTHGPWGSGDALSMLAGEHQHIFATGLYAAIFLKIAAILSLALGVFFALNALRAGKYQLKGIFWDEPSNELPDRFAFLLEAVEKHYKKAIETNDTTLDKKTKRMKKGILYGLLGALCSFFTIAIENGASLLVAAG